MVADSDKEAKALASRAYKNGSAASEGYGSQNRSTSPPLKNLYPDTWEELEGLANGCAGSPATVRRYALEEVERCGTNYLVSWFAFGDLTVDQVIRSLELFGEHVMPAFA